MGIEDKFVEERFKFDKEDVDGAVSQRGPVADTFCLTAQDRVVLDRVDKGDWVGLVTRALREKMPLSQLTLREDRLTEGLSKEEKQRRLVNSLAQRGLMGETGPDKGQVRKGDDPALIQKMFQMLIMAGYAVKTDPDSTRTETGKLSDSEISQALKDNEK